MLTQHPTLLIGPADWQPDVMPREEFADRIEALWHAFPAAERAIIYGDPRAHAELAYLTHLTPKLEASAALLTRDGAHRVFAGGGPSMIAAARPLTWIADVQPLGKFAEAIRAGTAAGPTLVAGADAMSTAFRKTVMDTIGPGRAQDSTAQLWSQMCRKSPREIVAIGKAHETMMRAWGEASDVFESEAAVTEVVLAGERVAIARGAQDVRTLFSLDGGRTLRPFEKVIDAVHDPMIVYMAVRQFNYWVEDFWYLSNRRDGWEAFEAASHALKAALAAIKAGTSTREIEQMIDGSIAPFRRHPVTIRAFAQRMGIALDAPPHADIGAAFEADEIYSVRVGTTDSASRHAVQSQMIRVRDSGVDVLSDRAGIGG